MWDGEGAVHMRLVWFNDEKSVKCLVCDWYYELLMILLMQSKNVEFDGPLMMLVVENA